MSVKELHEKGEEQLKRNGYDGLYRPQQCACMKNEFMPFGKPNIRKWRRFHKSIPNKEDKLPR